MKVLPDKSVSGLYWVILLTAFMVFIMFANVYLGKGRAPMLGFIKKPAGEQE